MKRIEFTDVTLRDGLQMEAPVPTESKLELLAKLALCGFDRIEVTSFVNPARVPQFSDAASFASQAAQLPGLPPLMAFVPNVRGAERLFEHSIEWVACFVSVSETFNARNVNCSVAESLAQVAAVTAAVRAQGRKVRVYVSTVFGCPYEGATGSDRLTRVLQTLGDLGPDEVALGDTIGVATPAGVASVLELTGKFIGLGKIAMHLHNTYGMAVASARTAYQVGVRRFDGSTGGIGGCPYAKGATGNVASEDLLYAFFRDGLCEFKAQPLREALGVLRDSLGLQPQGALAQVWKNNGQWYGV